MKKTIDTAIEIKASPQKIWNIISTTNAYQDWNPFIRAIDGFFEQGRTIKVSLHPPGGGSFTFKPVILKASFPEIRWRGKFLFKGLFDGEHYFRVESVSSHLTRFIHGEYFSGILVSLMSGTLEKSKRGFELMNEALKKRAER